MEILCGSKRFLPHFIGLNHEKYKATALHSKESLYQKKYVIWNKAILVAWVWLNVIWYTLIRTISSEEEKKCILAIRYSIIIILQLLYHLIYLHTNICKFMFCDLHFQCSPYKYTSIFMRNLAFFYQPCGLSTQKINTTELVVYLILFHASFCSKYTHSEALLLLSDKNLYL